MVRQHFLDAIGPSPGEAVFSETGAPVYIIIAAVIIAALSVSAVIFIKRRKHSKVIAGKDSENKSGTNEER